MRKIVALVSVMLMTVSLPALAQDTTEIAKASQNPVGDMVSVPFQFNFNGGGGLEDQTHFNLNFQPVFPMHVTSSIGVIVRPIIPFHSFPGAAGAQNGGFGDIQTQVFLTPARPGKVIWGVGPMFSLPTATAIPAQTGTWAGGINTVILAMPGPWVLGSLISQVWPMNDTGGPPETDVFSWQYFVNYNFGRGWALSSTPTIIANWDAPDGQQWTVPFGLGISRTVIFRNQPMSLGLTYFHNVKRPDSGPATQLRFNVSLLFPMKR